MDLWEVRANRTKTRRSALTAPEPLGFPRISSEIAVVLAAAVDGMLSQPRWIEALRVLAQQSTQHRVLQAVQGLGIWRRDRAEVLQQVLVRRHLEGRIVQ